MTTHLHPSGVSESILLLPGHPPPPVNSWHSWRNVKCIREVQSVSYHWVQWWFSIPVLTPHLKPTHHNYGYFSDTQRGTPEGRVWHIGGGGISEFCRFVCQDRTCPFGHYQNFSPASSKAIIKIWVGESNSAEWDLRNIWHSDYYSVTYGPLPAPPLHLPKTLESTDFPDLENSKHNQHSV